MQQQTINHSDSQSRKRKTKSINEQQTKKNNRGGRLQSKYNQISHNNGLLNIQLQSHKKVELENLQKEITSIINQFPLIENFILINSLNMNAQSKANYQQYLERIKTLKLKRVSYYLTSVQAIDIILKNIIHIPLILDTNFIQEIIIYINPKQFENQCYIKKSHQLPSQVYQFPKLKVFSLSMQERVIEDKDYQQIEFLLKSIHASLKLENIKLNFGLTKFENENLLEKIICNCLSQFKNLKNLNLDYTNISQLNKINYFPISSTQLRILQVNLSMISINQNFITNLQKTLITQSELKFLDLNLSKTNMDIRKLRQLINSIIQLEKLETLILDLSGNIFCQSFKNKIFDEEQDIIRKDLKEFILNFNSTSSLSDEHTTISPDFFILLKFNVKKLVLDISNTIQTYESLNVLGQELEQINCVDLKIKLNNTRILFDQVIFFSKHLHNCRNLLRLTLELKNNMFLDSQINLIVASFVQTKFMHLSLIFDVEQKFKLINDYAINNIFLLKSNLVNVKQEKILFIKRLFLQLIIKLQKFRIEPFLDQFLLDII